MLRYGYFDSEITGFDEEGMPIFDRAETSEFIAMFLSKIISNGVLAAPPDCFQVVAGEGMVLKIKPGFGIIQGHFAADEKEAEVEIPKAPATHKRIDRVVLRVNYLQRLCEIIVKPGTADAAPAPPELLQPASGDYYELCLATVAVNSNQTVITQAHITDTRYDSSVCGVVTQLVDHLDTAAFFEQLEAFYKEFMAECGDALDQIEESGNIRLSEIMAALSALVSTNGVWRNDIAYQRYSIVTITYDEETRAYVAINDVPPGIVPPNEIYWAPITLKGDTGADGVVVPVEKHYCFQVTDGHLWLYYADGEEAPNFTINDDGHLIYEISE